MASVVGAAIRQTEELPASFIAISGDGDGDGDRLAALDRNSNGIIDADDLQEIAGSFGAPAGEGRTADANGDGVVDVVDLALAGRYYGQQVGR